MTAHCKLKLLKNYQEQGIKLWEFTIAKFRFKLSKWRTQHHRKYGDPLPDILKIYTDKLENEYQTYIFEFMKCKGNSESEYNSRFEDISKTKVLLEKKSTVSLDDISDIFRPIAERCLGIQLEIDMCIPEDI